MSEYPLDKDDVTVEEVIEDCGECTGTLTDAGHWVVVFFRSAGFSQHIGPYCRECAEEIARRIRDGLPSASAEDTGESL